MRRYAFTRISPGEYLVPSNDGASVFLFTSYEDGADHGLDVAYRRRRFWRVRSIPYLELIDLAGGTIDSAPWVDVSDQHGSRREAFEAIFGPDFPAVADALGRPLEPHPSMEGHQ
jgi:hypothetical protein